MSGGFTPGFRTSGTEIPYQPSVLASQHGMYSSGGVTFDSTAVTADANGNKIVPIGTIVTIDETSGKARPYTMADGNNVFGILVTTSLNLRDGDVVQGVLIHGSVWKARVPGINQAIIDSLPAINFQ